MTPRALHLDRQVELLAAVGAGDGDDLLTTPELATWLGVSTQWCEIGRYRGYGPPFVKISGRIRYRRARVRAWLDERAHRSTAEYSHKRRNGEDGPRRGAPVRDRRK